MSEYDVLEDRLREALSRIEAATSEFADMQSNAQAAAQANLEAADAIETLTAQLAEERSSNASLIERVEALKERQENEVARLEGSLEVAKAADAEKSAVQQELKARVEELRDQIARLTEANRSMVGDADLINTAMMAELAAMRAARRADVGEIDGIIAELDDQIEGTQNA